jgi:hypothetical protein
MFIARLVFTIALSLTGLAALAGFSPLLGNFFHGSEMKSQTIAAVLATVIGSAVAVQQCKSGFRRTPK